MRAEDIETLISVGRPEIAPDGSFAVFASSRPDVAANRGRRAAVARRAAGWRSAPAHQGSRGLRAPALAGRRPHRLPARRRQGQEPGLRGRRRGRGAGAGHRRPARRQRIRVVAGRRRASASSPGSPSADATDPSRDSMPRPRHRDASPRCAGMPTDSATSPTGRRSVFTVAAPATDAEPFYEPAAAGAARRRHRPEEAGARR